MKNKSLSCIKNYKTQKMQNFMLYQLKKIVLTNSKISCILMSIKKNIIQTHMVKKLQALHFLQYCLSKKAFNSKKLFLIFLKIFKTVSAVDLTFKF